MVGAKIFLVLAGVPRMPTPPAAPADEEAPSVRSRSGRNEASRPGRLAVSGDMTLDEILFCRDQTGAINWNFKGVVKLGGLKS